MISFPNCKINLGLDILRKRADGYHDLETIFYPLPIYDVLEIIASPGTTSKSEPGFTLSGATINGNREDNLCMKAWRLLEKDFPQLPSLQVHLHKIIPTGAGLGGGSADGSFTLKLLNEIAGLHLTTRQLIDYAAALGSDCPFFITNTVSFASGRGEIMEPIHLDLSMYKIMLVHPGIHINTAHAFSQITPTPSQHATREIIQLPVREWKDQLKNDFEIPVFKQYPEIGRIKNELYTAGALYASMTGSGSAVYGIFEKEKKLLTDFPANYFSREINL